LAELLPPDDRVRQKAEGLVRSSLDLLKKAREFKFSEEKFEKIGFQSSSQPTRVAEQFLYSSEA
jgi:hypothetical protein